MNQFAKETDIVHGVHPQFTDTMDLVPPIHLTSTFRFPNAEHGAELFEGKRDGYIYTRISNPTVDMFQEKMAKLEGGEAAIATSSGMAAIASVSLALAKPGDHIVSCSTLYGGTYALFNKHLPALNIHTDFLSPAESCIQTTVENAVKKNTKFLYLETPANPTMDIIDIAMWAGIAKHHGISLVVDNTFASPYLQTPLALGADIIIHSTTKYIGGHGDIVGGVIIGASDMIKHIKNDYSIHFGPNMSPFNAWLFLRGLKTLAVRMDRHCDNAVKIAHWLEKHPNVDCVYYPGLSSHPNYAIAKQQMRKFGGMIAFDVKGGVEAGRSVMNNVKLCTLAVSLGDCETLIQHPASMTHSTYSETERKKAGITDGLVRLSVGLENADDIIADLNSALNKI